MIMKRETIMRISFAVMFRRKAWTAAAVAGLVCGLSVSAGALAQGFPTKPIHLIVPNAPGGAIDILARTLSVHLQPFWGQPVVVDYKPGAGTVLGTDYVAKSAPDGHTLGMVITGHVINPSLRPNMPFDTVKDLSGVTLLGIAHILISATPSFEANNIAELIALAKKQPGKISYASPGSGSSMHLAGELLKTMSGIDLVHIPYKGSGPAYPDVIAGRVQLLIDPLFSSMSYVKGGRLKPIAVTNPSRASIAAEIPTVAETIPGFSVQSIFGIVASSQTPHELVRKISADIVSVLRVPEVKARMAELGMETVGNTPEQFDAYIRTEIDKWAKVVKASGAKVD